MPIFTSSAQDVKAKASLLEPSTFRLVEDPLEVIRQGLCALKKKLRFWKRLQKKGANTDM